MNCATILLSIFLFSHHTWPEKFTKSGILDHGPLSKTTLPQNTQSETKGWVVVWQGRSAKSGTSDHEMNNTSTKVEQLLNARVTSKVRSPQNRFYFHLEMENNPTNNLPVTQEYLNATLSREPGFLAVAPNYIRHINGVNDPLFEQQWALKNVGQTNGKLGADISVEMAWQTTSGDKNVIVAVIDTGINTDHPDLKPNLWINNGETPGNGIDDDGNGWIDDAQGYDFANQRPSPYDVIGHGTHVAGIIAARADNGEGISGVAPEIQIMGLKIASDHGFLNDFSAIQAITYAQTMGAHILNLSWGGPGYSEPLRMAIEDAGLSGVLVVTAAGNDGHDLELNPSYPASFNLPNLLTVGATDHHDEKAFYSNYSSTKVTLFAPGDEILSTSYMVKFGLNETFDQCGGELPSGFTTSDPRFWHVVPQPTPLHPENMRLQLFTDTNQTSIPSEIFLGFPVITLDTDHPLQISFVLDIEGFETDYWDSNSNYHADMVTFQVQSVEGTWETFAAFQGSTSTHPRHHEVSFSPTSGIDEVKLRIVWKTEDVSRPTYGVVLDDLKVYQIKQESDDHTDYTPFYQVLSGTSMAAPQVCGVAGLLLSTHPDMSVSELTMRLIGGGTELEELEGFSMAARRLNAAGSLNLEQGMRWINSFNELAYSKPVYLHWSDLAFPEGPFTIELWQNGTHIQNITSNLKNQSRLYWHIPNLEPGPGYQLLLKNPNDQVYSQPFEIGAMELVHIEDDAFHIYAMSQFDRDGDEVLTGYEASLIQVLSCKQKGIKALPSLDLFQNLRNLDCSFNRLKSLPELKHVNSLLRLDCSFNQIHEVPDLPLRLFSLYCSGNQLSVLPEIKHLKLLQGLHFNQNNISQIPELPLSLSDFRGDGNHLTEDSFPDSFFDSPKIQLLMLRSNHIEHLPSLPPNLNFLYVGGNHLQTLPSELPASLWQLACDNNQLRQIPPLPDSLLSLDISGNPLSEFPALSHLEKLGWVFASRTGATRIPEVPDTAYFLLLHIYDNPLQAVDCSRVEELKEDLSGLPALYLQWTGIDGLIFNPQENLTQILCQNEPVVYQISELRAYRDGSQIRLHWGSSTEAMSDSGASPFLSHFNIYNEGRLIGSTKQSSFIVESLSAHNDHQFEVTPVFKNGQTGLTAVIIYNGIPSSYHQHFLHLFPGLSELWHGLAITNPYNEKVSFILTLRDDLGRVIEQTSVLNLNPHQKYIELLSNIFDKDSTNIGASLLEIRSTKRLSCVGLNGRNLQTVFAGTGASWNHTGLITSIYPEYNSIWGSFYSEEATILHLKGYDFEGHLLEEADINLDRFWQGELHTLFEKSQEIFMITWASDSPVSAESVKDSSQAGPFSTMQSQSWSSTPGLSGLLPLTNNFAFFYRYNEIQVHNPNPQSNFIRLNHFDFRGNWVQETALELEPFGTRIMPSSFLFFRAYSTQMVAYEAALPVQFLQQQSRWSWESEYFKVDSFEAITNFSDHLYVPHVAKSPYWETRIQLINPHDEDIPVLVTAYNSEGQSLGDHEVTILRKNQLDLDYQAWFTNGNVASMDIRALSHTIGGLLTFINQGDLATIQLEPVNSN